MNDILRKRNMMRLEEMVDVVFSKEVQEAYKPESFMR